MISVIKQKVDLIAECIYTKILRIEEKSFGLYSGDFGLLLFLLFYSRYSKNEKYALMAENYAEKLLEQFVAREHPHTFCSGFSGVMYLFEFLRETRIIDLDISPIQLAVDNYIISKMRLDIQQRYYDFMHGAMGVGLYFLKRKTNPEYIQELVDFLYDTAEKDFNNQTFKWESVVDYEKNLSGYNLALSHGISSIIIFLARVVNSGMRDEKITKMLSGAVNYVLSLEKDFSQFGSCFPNYILKDSPEDISKSRLAWCYGDLGTGSALWQAGKALGIKKVEEEGLQILLKSTQRRDIIECLVMDAGICHGSAGLAMIYRRMFLETFQEEFKNATTYWITQTLHFSRFEDGLAGYKSFMSGKWVCDFSLITGIAGIGLVLLSYLEDSQQDWDEMFLLS